MNRPDALEVLGDWLTERRPRDYSWWTVLDLVTGEEKANTGAACEIVDDLQDDPSPVVRELLWDAGLVWHGPPFPTPDEWEVMALDGIINRRGGTMTLRDGTGVEVTIGVDMSEFIEAMGSIGDSMASAASSMNDVFERGHRSALEIRNMAGNILPGAEPTRRRRAKKGPPPPGRREWWRR